ncbi:MAG: type II secretion system F family protein [Lentisphaerae bacterium]|nr:type II secretion system F family protein [Lentisphaerota bacterium]
MAVFRTQAVKAAPAAAPTAAPPSAQRPAARAAAEPRRTKAAATRVVGAKSIRNKELPPFSRQLSAMLLAGMPLIQALDALEDQTSDKNFKMVVLGLKNYLHGGASFSEALTHYPSIFDQLYVNMIKAGESGGQLGETAARLAGFLEDAAKLTRKVKSAMSYPVIVMCIALGIATAMILFIVPVFAKMFAEFNQKLPAPTQFLINMSNTLKSYGVYVLAVGIGAFIAFQQWKKTSRGAYRLSAFALKIPVIGELNRKVATSRFARTFAQLLKSGVPILQAMEIVSRATGNRVFESVILEARTTVEQGETLSSALVKYSCFPKLLVHMLAAGEKTGKIDEMMQNIADFYDDEVDTMLSGLTSLIEPMLMIFLGVVIGGIVISMFLPIFKMGEVVGGG